MRGINWGDCKHRNNAWWWHLKTSKNTVHVLGKWVTHEHIFLPLNIPTEWKLLGKRYYSRDAPRTRLSFFVFCSHLFSFSPTLSSILIPALIVTDKVFHSLDTATVMHLYSYGIPSGKELNKKVVPHDDHYTLDKYILFFSIWCFCNLMICCLWWF